MCVWLPCGPHKMPSRAACGATDRSLITPALEDFITKTYNIHYCTAFWFGNAAYVLHPCLVKDASLMPSWNSFTFNHTCNYRESFPERLHMQDVEKTSQTMSFGWYYCIAQHRSVSHNSEPHAQHCLSCDWWCMYVCMCAASCVV